MNRTKAIIDFTNYTAAQLGPIAQTIHEKMTENAATFASPPIPMTELRTLVIDYDEKLVARTSRASAAVIALREARRAIEEALRVLGQYVIGVAKGDPTIVERSGFPFYRTAHAPDYSPPVAPANLRLRHGDVTGAILARYKVKRQKSANEVQTCTGDPNVEVDWIKRGMFRGGRVNLSDLPPGEVVWVRVRTVGLKAVMGAWSDPAQIRVR